MSNFYKIILIIIFLSLSKLSFPNQRIIQLSIFHDTEDTFAQKLVDTIQTSMSQFYLTLGDVQVKQIENDGTYTLENLSEKFSDYHLILIPEIKKLNFIEYQFVLNIYQVDNKRSFPAGNHYFTKKDINGIKVEIESIIDNLNWILRGVPFKVLTSPENANVYINGEYIGKTPLNQLSGMPSKYQLEITKKGYHNFSDNINLKKGHDNKYHYVLQRSNYIHNKNKLNFKYVYTYADDAYTKFDPYVPVLFSYEYFIENYSFEVETGIFNLEREITINTNPKVTDKKTISVVPLTLSFKYHFLQEYQVSPFIGLGGGLAFISIAETEHSQLNPLVYGIVGINFGFLDMSKSESRIHFFVEGRVYHSGKVKVGEGQFNLFGIKQNDDTKITLKGFQILAGISYVFF